MKTKLTVFFLASLIFASCQKELDINVDSGIPNNGNGGTPGNGNGNSATGLLVKVVEVIDNTDTLTTLYTYDSQKRLATETMDGMENGMQIHSYKRFERDATGRITRIRQFEDQNGLASDTAVNTIHYPDASTFNYNYTLNNIGVSGFSVVDSSVYSYSGGKMMTVTSYLTSTLLGPIAAQTSKFDFTYDGSGRISTMKMYSADPVSGGPLLPLANQTYTYGSSLNALYATNNGAQNYLLGGMPNASNDAMTSLKMEDLTGANPGINALVKMTYVLGAGNRPLSMVATTTGAQPTVSKSSFYYQ
jgi:hypothetical protein